MCHGTFSARERAAKQQGLSWKLKKTPLRIIRGGVCITFLLLYCLFLLSRSFRFFSRCLLRRRILRLSDNREL